MARRVVNKVKARELSENEMDVLVRAAMDRIDDDIRALDHMTKAQAKDYYERVIDRCQTSVEVLEQEIENEA